MDYSSYIFDLDGTLLNTLTDLMNSTNFALREMGFPERTYEEMRRFVGNGVNKQIERSVPEGTSPEDILKTVEIFKRHYSEHSLDTTAPYPGIMDMLKRLKARGAKMAIVSNKFYDATQALCRHFFSDYIDIAIGEKSGIRKKPAPDTVYEALKQLGVGKEGAVYVGDSEVDFNTARNSGLHCISCLWGFRDKDFLIQQGATTFVNSPNEI